MSPRRRSSRSCCRSRSASSSPCSAFNIAAPRRSASVFGPTMLVWFLALAVLGLGGILRAPEVLAALDPLHGYRFFAAHGASAFGVLGAVFLVVTGGEALYADMGHFGRAPDPPRLVRGRAAGAGAQLLRPGCLGAEQSGRDQTALLRARPDLGPLPSGPAGDRSHRDRLAGGDFRSVLADRPDRLAAVAAAPQHHPHLRRGEGADLHPERQLDPDGRNHRSGARLSAPRVASRQLTASRSRP